MLTMNAAASGRTARPPNWSSRLDRWSVIARTLSTSSWPMWVCGSRRSRWNRWDTSGQPGMTSAAEYRPSPSSARRVGSMSALPRSTLGLR